MGGAGGVVVGFSSPPTRRTPPLPHADGHHADVAAHIASKLNTPGAFKTAFPVLGAAAPAIAAPGRLCLPAPSDAVTLLLRHAVLSTPPLLRCLRRFAWTRTLQFTKRHQSHSRGHQANLPPSPSTLSGRRLDHWRATRVAGGF